MQMPFVRRTWVEIDLDVIVHNYKEVCRLCEPGVKVTCVLKSNAYGHGAVEVAKALAAAGAGSFAVSCAREAFELRRGGITGEILVMTVTEKEALPAAIREEFHLTVASAVQAHLVQEAAQSVGKKAVIHLKVDTGMHRLGFTPNARAVEEMHDIGRLSHILVQGIYSHLSLNGKAQDEKQHERLIAIAGALAERGMHIPEMHICDSIGMVRYPKWHYQRVRTGAMLFGVRPMGSGDMDFQCREALCFKTLVTQVTQVEAGETVGYDGEAPLTRPTLVATLCAGYGDGYPRCMSRVGSVLIRGKLAPVLGLVCMDQMMVDVTDIPGVSEGDEATLLGGGISYMQYASWAHTNRNEAITIVSRRPQRVYMNGGRVVKVLDYLLQDGGIEK